MASPKFSSLTANERAWIAQHLEAAQAFVADMSPVDAGQSVTLDALDRAFTTWLPQCGEDMAQVNSVINIVGIQFGQSLVDQLGFDWTIAKDSHGTDLAVRALPRRGDVLIYPANFVAKRWERREANFLVDAFDKIGEQVEAVARMHAEQPRPWWRFWR